MRRNSPRSVGLAFASALFFSTLFTSHDSDASTSIAVTLDTLVQRASAIAVVIPEEQPPPLRRGSPAVLLTVFSSRSFSHGAFCRKTTLSSVPCSPHGSPLYWKGRCVSFAVSRAASKQIDFDTASRTLTAAFDAWTTAQCAYAGGSAPPSIAVLPGGPTDVTDVEFLPNGPNVNAVIFRDDAWPHQDPDETVALVTVTFDASSGAIKGAGMEINTAQYKFTVTSPVPPDGYDLQSILTHEAGHFLGFSDSLDANTTMGIAYEPGSTSKSKLSADDVAAVCTVYAPDGTHLTGTGPIVADPCTSAPPGATCGQTVEHACSIGHFGTRGGGLAALAYAGVTLGLIAIRRRRSS